MRALRGVLALCLAGLVAGVAGADEKKEAKAKDLIVGKWERSKGHTLEFTKAGRMIILVGKKKTVFSYKVIDDNTVAVTGKVGGRTQTRKQKFKVTKDEFEWANPLDGKFDGSQQYKRIK